MFYSIYIMTIANKDERALFYFFLLYLTLTFAYGFDVHFEIRCDDYCIRVLDGSTVVKNMKIIFPTKMDCSYFKVHLHWPILFQLSYKMLKVLFLYVEK